MEIACVSTVDVIRGVLETTSCCVTEAKRKGGGTATRSMYCKIRVEQWGHSIKSQQCSADA